MKTVIDQLIKDRTLAKRVIRALANTSPTTSRGISALLSRYLRKDINAKSVSSVLSIVSKTTPSIKRTKADGKMFLYHWEGVATEGAINCVYNSYKNEEKRYDENYKLRASQNKKQIRKAPRKVKKELKDYTLGKIVKECALNGKSVSIEIRITPIV